MPAPDLMLAQRGKPDSIDFLTKRGFLFDLKVDGIRCYSEVVRGVVTMWSRSGENVTTRYGEVAAVLAETFPEGSWTFDGELVVHDERGLPSWPLTQKRIGKRNAVAALPLTYHVFDALRVGGFPLGKVPFGRRRELLENHVPPKEHLTPVLHSPDGRRLWEIVQEHRLEGIVAKRADHLYRPGRHGDWVKIKSTSTISCLVGGYDPGEGARAATFGALHLYLLDGQNLVSVGKVGSGFSERELREVSARMHESSLIVEVEYLDVSPDGQLRQPVFRGVREDQQITDCTINQLEVG